MITSEGHLYHWGLCASSSSPFSATSLSGNDCSDYPVRVAEVEDVAQVCSGYAHFVLRTTGGEVYTAGSGVYGQLGYER